MTELARRLGGQGCGRDRARVDGRRRGLRGLGAGCAGGRVGLLIGVGDRRVRCLLQRCGVGPAGCGLSGLGWHVCLRPGAARAVVGIRRRLCFVHRQDGVVCRDGADVRDVRSTGAEWARRLVALAAVVVLAAVNYRGITRTARADQDPGRLHARRPCRRGACCSRRPDRSRHRLDRRLRPYGVLQAAGLLFFAFAGYARIATMGEEVREPARTIPRAITIALLRCRRHLSRRSASCLLLAVGPDSDRRVARAFGRRGRRGRRGLGLAVVRVGAALASLGALLALIAGIGRTSLAMARNHDLPAWLAAVHPRFQVPHHAEIVLAVVVGVLVLTTDLRGVIGFSSFGVLLYYAIANAAAYHATGRPASLAAGPQRGRPGWVVSCSRSPCRGVGRRRAVLLRWLALLVRTIRTGRAGSARS